ncbi:hypothetical protein [Halomicrococcus gelatinilyticus]|uniref:hypothetical protein n=1 Tax=Halomicrococcus gelatinilyticus TaxID=1702103 RepID=UPI002E1100E1
MERQHRWLVGVLAGVAFGGGVSALGAGVAFAASVAFVWCVGVALALRLNRYASDAGTFAVARWSGLASLVMLVPAMFGLLELPVSADLRLALGLLVVGTGFAGTQVGVATMVEREKEREEGSVSGGMTDATSASASDGAGNGD